MNDALVLFSETWSVTRNQGWGYEGQIEGGRERHVNAIVDDSVYLPVGTSRLTECVIT